MNDSNRILQNSRLARLLQFLADDPENQTLRLDIFDLALELGQEDLVQSCIEAGLDANPHDARWIYRRALVASQAGDHAGAETLLLDLLNQQGASDPIMYRLALVQFFQGKSRQAIPTLQHLVSNSLETEPQALPLLMRCLQREGLVREALDVFALNKADREVLPEAWGIASLIATDASDVENAKQWSAHALRSYPLQREAMISRGTLALAAEKFAEAKSVLEECLKHYPESGRAISGLGLMYMFEKDYATALACLERGLARMPTHIGTWHASGWCRIALKDLRGARNDFDTALELDRNFAESHGGLAVVMIMSNERNQAQDHIDRALRLDPSCVSGLYAQALARGGSIDQRTLRRMARTLLGGRTTLDGADMADTVMRHMK